jgi:hypothetical protein
VGGAIVEGISWEWIFWVNVPIGLITIPLALTRMRESFGPGTGLDLRGLALVTASAFGLVWGLVRGNQVGWGSLEVVGSLAVGTVLALGFVLWELREREPMQPMRLFRLSDRPACSRARPGTSPTFWPSYGQRSDRAGAQRAPRALLADASRRRTRRRYMTAFSSATESLAS